MWISALLNTPFTAQCWLSFWDFICILRFFFLLPFIKAFTKLHPCKITVRLLYSHKNGLSEQMFYNFNLALYCKHFLSGGGWECTESNESFHMYFQLCICGSTVLSVPDFSGHNQTIGNSFPPDAIKSCEGPQSRSRPLQGSKGLKTHSPTLWSQSGSGTTPHLPLAPNYLTNTFPSSKAHLHPAK